MKTSLRARLALSYLAVILVGMGVIAPLAWLAVERMYRATQTDNLLAQARLIASVLTAGPLPGSALGGAYTQTSNLASGIHTRVIDAQSAAVIDLYAPARPDPAGGLSLPALAQNAAGPGPVTPEELLSRPEIAQARLGRPATAIRHVTGAGGEQPILYAAAPVLDSCGNAVQIVYLATPLPDTRWAALPPGLRWQFLGVLAAAILAAGGSGLLLARQIARPLDRLAEAAGGVASGDLDQAVPEDPSIHELASLSRSFNQMTVALRQSEQVRNAFLADVTHELRTPLTVIKGTVETLQDGAVDDLEARGPFLESLGRETERLIRLVNDLLVLARAEAGALNLRCQPLDLAELARSRCDTLRPAAARRGVGLEITGGPALEGQPGCLVQADPDRLAQVLDNLLDNAVRHSSPGGLVTVALTRQGGEVACRVTDQGPGIPARHLPFIFERFYRADPARQRSQTGSGLGLAIVRGLVAAHGGRVTVESQAGQGASFTVWLPGG